MSIRFNSEMTISYDRYNHYCVVRFKNVVSEKYALTLISL